MPAQPRVRSVAKKLLSLPQADGDALRTWVRFVRTYQALQQRLGRVLESAGLTLPQFDVLANLGMTEGITQQELADKLLVTKGNVVGLLDRMESAGLVERRADPTDRRANRIHLTRRGRDALRQAFPAHRGVLREAMARLSAADRQALSRLLERIDLTED
jgi:DNA-binding MarR family transcriptional regulator